MPDFRNFACDRCGACCSSLLVEATYEDAQREPRLYEIASTGLDHEMFRDGSHTIRLRSPVTRACPFLGHENKCEIYPTRPHACVSVEPGDAKCQQARELKRLPILLDRDGNPPTREMMLESADEYELDGIPYWPDDLAERNTKGG